MINGFVGEYRWLSNFWPCEITAKDGTVFGSVEAAYQATKTTDPETFKSFAGLSPSEAKKAGRKLTLRSDWDKIKIRVMERLAKLVKGE
jgi:predicted NAD-dependent protein-ADP-ribosyltransferase YbiA (DUF1768 family)